MENNNEIETLDIDIDDLFKDPEEGSPQAEQEKEPEKKNEEMTKAVSERINTVKKKTESDTEDRVAKELGFENYADMKKANEKKLLKDAGLDDEELMATVEKIVEQRLASDPRMKKLQEIEENEKTRFVKSQLQEINELTGEKFTSVDQLSEETLKLWEKIGNLKQAYLATEGQKLIGKSRSKDNGSLAHMANGGQSSSGSPKTRLLNDEEKAIYRLVNPEITDEELNKKTINID